MTDLLIREAQMTDAPAILAYLKQIGSESDHLLFDQDSFNQTTVAQEADLIQELSESPNSVMLVAFTNQHIVSIGTLVGYRQPKIAHRTRLAISVSRSYWHQGIGNNMLIELIHFAKNAQLEIIELEVKSNNPYAIRLYQKNGFIEHGRYPNFFKINHQYYDAILMSLKLK